jgi:hypothetical protein
MSSKPTKASSDKETGKNIPQKIKRGKSVKELVEKHMKDKNDIITEEDIGALDLTLDEPDTSTSHTPDIPDDSERPKDEDKDPKVVTPWDVIKE